MLNIGTISDCGFLAGSESQFTYQSAQATAAAAPTPGTGIASKDAPTSFSETAGIMNIYNSASFSGGDNQYIVPVFLRLTATTANTGATNFRLVGILDTIDRYSSGGTTLVGKSTSLDSRTGYADRTAKATVNFGDLTLAASSADKVVFNAYVSDGILAADEVVEIWFTAGTGTQPTNTSGNVIVVPPVYIGRGQNLAIHDLAGSQSADPAFEVECLMIETGHPRFE